MPKTSTLELFFALSRPEIPLPFPWYMRGEFTPLHPEGAKMHNPFAFDDATRNMLDALGAEPLAGSGFENEQTDPAFKDGEVLGEEA